METHKLLSNFESIINEICTSRRVSVPVEPASLTVLPLTLARWLNTSVTPRQFQLQLVFLFLSIGLMLRKLLSCSILLLIIWNVINLKPKTHRTSSKLLYNDNGVEAKNIINRLKKEILVVNFKTLDLNTHVISSLSDFFFPITIIFNGEFAAFWILQKIRK